MKKLLLGLAIATISVGAQASYLYWQVNGDETWTSSGGSTLRQGLSEYTITEINLYGSSGKETSLLSPAGTSITPTTYWNTKNIYVNVGDVSDSASYSYFVEIVGYRTNGGSSSATEVIAYSSTMTGTYADLRTAGSLQDELSAMSASITPMMGPSYMAPEPTSGLLLLLGGALLALKRRRV